MKVGDLVRRLQSFPADMEVVVDNSVTPAWMMVGNVYRSNTDRPIDLAATDGIDFERGPTLCVIELINSPDSAGGKSMNILNRYG